MEEIKTIKELNGDADYNVIKAKPEAERVKFPIEHFDAFVLYMRNLLLQKTPMLEDGLEDLQAWKNNFVLPTKEELGLGAYTADPKGLPLQTEAEEKFNQKANLINTDYQVLSNVSNQFTPHYSEGSPLFTFTMSANATLQLSSMNGLSKGTIFVRVKKTSGSLVLTLKDGTTTLTGINGTPSTTAGYDDYTIEKFGTEYIIKVEPLQASTNAPAGKPKLPNLSFSAVQVAAVNGVKQVKLTIGAPVAGASIRVIRENIQGYGSPVKHEGVGYPNAGIMTNGVIMDNGSLPSAPTNVFQTGKRYYYAAKQSHPDYADSDYTESPVTIQNI